MDQIPSQEPAAVAASSERKAGAHRRKVVALFVTGLAMPAVFGMGAAVVAALFDLGFRGMDDYVPLFLGALVGCCVGSGFAVAGVIQMVLAKTRGRRAIRSLGHRAW
ncbi:MAG TPA: hypothetical protein DFR83_04175 [Deltaproteobacteria bacterium]|nr:hypothetical protein [Deltaproteobacteria bacterium]